MAIVATLPRLNLFSSLPTTPPPQNDPTTTTTPPPPPPPIPIPKYPPPLKTQKSQNHPKTFKNPKTHPKTPAFNTHHRNSKYYKPIKPGQVLSPETNSAVDGGDRSILVGETGISYRLPGAPFEFSFSYSEIPKVKPLALREPAFLPFAPPSMPRPWTGKAPLKKKKTRKIKLFDANDGDDEEYDSGENIVKHYEMLKAYELGKYEMRPREQVLGEPLSRMEIKELLRPLLSSNKQVNLGRDGLTHNMLELIHSHWRRQPVCKVRCLGVPTVDMDNICCCLEEKTGGKIIHRVGGVVYIFRGRNYDHQNRPKLPVMLWKPAAPVYPKLIQEAPEGLTKEEADELRIKGKNLVPICKLAKNGVYVTLVRDVRIAFEGCPLVKIDCKGMHASDYKKLGAKLKELVPCELLSFDDEQILMWRGKDWKPRYRDVSPSINPGNSPKANVLHTSGNQSAKFHESEAKRVSSSPRMMSLWERAIESGKALLLDEIKLGPDDLLAKVEQLESISQATEHSYPALILSSKDGSGFSRTQNEYATEDDDYNEDETYTDEHNGKDFINAVFDAVESSPPLGSLPVDFIAEELSDNEPSS